MVKLLTNLERVWFPSSLKKKPPRLRYRSMRGVGPTTFNALITTKHIRSCNISSDIDGPHLLNMAWWPCPPTGPLVSQKESPASSWGQDGGAWMVGALVTQTLVTGFVVDARLTQAASLVARFNQIDGYRCLSLMRALAVVKCQSALVWFAFRSCSQAAISSMRACLSGMRRSRH